MVIKATIKIIRKVIVTPTNADVSTQVCVSKEFDWMTIVGSSSGVVWLSGPSLVNGKANWTSLGARTWKCKKVRNICNALAYKVLLAILKGLFSFHTIVAFAEIAWNSLLWKISGKMMMIEGKVVVQFKRNNLTFLLWNMKVLEWCNSWEKLTETAELLQSLIYTCSRKA